MFYLLAFLLSCYYVSPHPCKHLPRRIVGLGQNFKEVRLVDSLGFNLPYTCARTFWGMKDANRFLGPWQTLCTALPLRKGASTASPPLFQHAAQQPAYLSMVLGAQPSLKWTRWTACRIEEKQIAALPRVWRALVDRFALLSLRAPRTHIQMLARRCRAYEPSSGYNLHLQDHGVPVSA